MKKAIMISIQPQWVAKILNGEKTIEIRKTIPKCDLPINVYIYCTKATYGYTVGHQVFSLDDLTLNPDTNEYQCGDSCYIMCSKNKYSKDNFLNGKVVAKFTLNKVEDLKPYVYSVKDGHFYDLLENACLTVNDLSRYQNITQTEYYNGTKKSVYAWHIDNLEIFDKPKELSDYKLNNAPQSWCYVEVEE